MNLTFGSTAVSTWRRIKVQHLALAGGLALVASLAIGIGGWQVGTSDATLPPGVASPVRPFELADAVPHIMYVVATDAQAEQIRQNEQFAAMELGGGLPAGNYQTSSIIVNPTPVEISAVIAELNAIEEHYGPGLFRFVDLR